MSYVTQGTVKLELKTANDATFFVTPSAEYAVKHNGKPYIVFIDGQSNAIQSRLFETVYPFKSQESHFVQLLREAAFNRTKIEISMNSDCTKIESLTIPASS